MWVERIEQPVDRPRREQRQLVFFGETVIDLRVYLRGGVVIDGAKPVQSLLVVGVSLELQSDLYRDEVIGLFQIGKIRIRPLRFGLILGIPISDRSTPHLELGQCELFVEVERKRRRRRRPRVTDNRRYPGP